MDHTITRHLNEYLYYFNIIETSECVEKETVDHYLLNCELYYEERDALRRSVGADRMRSNILLGDSHSWKAVQRQ